MANLSENELQALSINAMGRASEGGTSAMMKIGFASNIVSGKPVNNSGFTIGFFQWDFAQKGNESAREFIDEYNNWANKLHQSKIQDVDQAVKDLRQNRDRGWQYDIRSAALGKQLNSFLASPDGYRFNLKMQERQFNEDLSPMLRDMAQTPALKNMSQDDARTALAVLAKIKNQTGPVGFRRFGADELLSQSNATPQTLLDRVHQRYPPKDGKPHDVVTGVEATVRGAELFNKLTHDTGRLGKIFRAQMGIDPTLTKSGFQTHAEPQVLDALFRNPAAGKKLIDAVNTGREYQIDNHANKISDEAYTVGVTADGKLYSVDKTGRGFYAGRDGHWQTLNQLQDIGVQFKTQGRKDRAEADMAEPTLAHYAEEPASMSGQKNTPGLRTDLTPEETRVAAQIRDCCRAPHNQGRFDRLSGDEQDNLVAALLPGAMRWIGDPKLGTNDVGRVVMTEKGITAVELGARNLPGAYLKTDEAIQQPVDHSLALLDKQYERTLDQQRQQELTQSQGGLSGPTRTLT